jgi:N-acetylglucosaminyldiphosphoundecaprenol N-acetyl-beta-D-mannosaminyltransferase
MFRLLDLAEREGYGVFLLGGRAEVLDRAVENLRGSHPHLRIAGSHHGYFSDDESAAICEAINEAQAAILFVAMTSPRKEYWVHAHRDALSVPLIMGVGGAIDIIAGITTRAPQWMQRAGLEWAYRFLQEPRRLGRRYLVTNVRFIAMVLAAISRRAANGRPVQTKASRPLFRSGQGPPQS